MGLEVHDVSAKPILASETTHPDQHLPSLPTNAPPDSTSCQPGPTSGSSTQSPNLCSSSAALLESNMVITVEPGIYFSRFVIDYYTSTHDSRIKFINKDVLEKYFPVGGVRIEDDILVTETGYENITTAPKGEEMLRLIREGWGKCSNECECSQTGSNSSDSISDSDASMGGPVAIEAVVNVRMEKPSPFQMAKALDPRYMMEEKACGCGEGRNCWLCTRGS